MTAATFAADDPHPERPLSKLALTALVLTLIACALMGGSVVVMGLGVVFVEQLAIGIPFGMASWCLSIPFVLGGLALGFGSIGQIRTDQLRGLMMAFTAIVVNTLLGAAHLMVCFTVVASVTAFVGFMTWLVNNYYW